MNEASEAVWCLSEFGWGYVTSRTEEFRWPGFLLVVELSRSAGDLVATISEARLDSWAFWGECGACCQMLAGSFAHLRCGSWVCRCCWRSCMPWYIPGTDRVLARWQLVAGSHSPAGPLSPSWLSSLD